MKTQQLLDILRIIFWILFIGFLIKAGVLLFNFGMSIWNPEGSKNLYLGLNLFDLRSQSTWQFIHVGTLLITVISLQAYITYLVIKISSIIRLQHPFTKEIAHLLSQISHVALGSGIVSIIADSYCKQLLKQGFDIPLAWGGKELLFLAAIIFIISKIFQKGIDLQTESDLTI